MASAGANSERLIQWNVARIAMRRSHSRGDRASRVSRVRSPGSRCAPTRYSAEQSTGPQLLMRSVLRRYSWWTRCRCARSPRALLADEDQQREHTRFVPRRIEQRGDLCQPTGASCELYSRSSVRKGRDGEPEEAVAFAVVAGSCLEESLRPAARPGSRASGGAGPSRPPSAWPKPAEGARRQQCVDEASIVERIVVPTSAGTRSSAATGRARKPTKATVPTIRNTSM